MSKVLVSVAAILLSALLFPISAMGEGGGRVPYIIFSEESTLKSAFGVRHAFPGMFTSNLSAEEAAMLERLGIRTESVKLYHPSERFAADSLLPARTSGGKGRTFVPSDQTPWGIETIYGSSAITSTSGGNGVNVAVLDTGVDKGHLDLKRRVTGCVDFTAEPPKEGRCSDSDGHGTHVAGTILADGGSDGKGIYGVAPGANLLAYKVCGSTGCWGDDIAAAIDRAKSKGAYIVSMSLSGDSEDILIRDAISRNPGLLYVAAAGNDGPDPGSIDYPAADLRVIAVGAIDVSWSVATFSSRGVNDGDCVIEAREVEFGAPGVNVLSTYKSGLYAYASGTSMATPHVSGLAAKMWQGTAAATRSLLKSLATDILPAGDDPATGFGLPRVVGSAGNACALR